MLIEENIEIKWTKGNKERYEALGYPFSKLGDKLVISNAHLNKGSHTLVKVQCDYCKDAKEVPFKDYKKQNEKDGLYIDACKSCGKFKRDELNLKKYGFKNVMKLDSTKEKLKNTMIERYGVEHYSQTSEFDEKVRNTALEKYGVEHYSQTEEYKEKVTATMLDRYGKDYYTQTEEYKTRATNTNLKKYGVSNPMQNKDVKQKVINTNIERYGVENVFQSEEIKERIKSYYTDNFNVQHVSQTDSFKENMRDKWKEWKEDGTVENILEKRMSTSLDRYGVPYPMQNSEISGKAFATMYKNGTAPCSSQQRHIHELIGGELNLPIGRTVLDIAFPSDKVYLEYDGGGHDLSVKLGSITLEEFILKERRRGYFLLNQGWKEIRLITTNDILPCDKDIKNFINIAKKYLIADNGFSVRWDLNKDEVIVNYKDVYVSEDFLLKYNTKEKVIQ